MNVQEGNPLKMEYDYRKELLDEVLPFWLKFSPDDKYGGYFTCLDSEGKVFDTDKFIWLQARQIWSFSKMYKEFDLERNYLDQAIQGAEFLLLNGRDKENNWYFSLDRKGNPLVVPYNIFSDCFVAMAFAALYKVQPDERYAEIARETFQNILSRKSNPKGKWEKKITGNRTLINFSLPMILSNLSLEMEDLLDDDLVDNLKEEVIDQVMNVFYNKDFKVILENVDSAGNFNDSFDGRLFNPGHNLEAMWFIMDLGIRKNDSALIEKAKNMSLQIISRGWDKKFGGIFYFLDIKGNPPQQLEWDQKLWWVHLEAMVCMIKAYQHTGDKNAFKWFKKLETYTWSHFRDKTGGEWFGYLNRQGEVLLPLKGGKWKGCFHVPRALYQISQMKEALKTVKPRIEI